MSDSAIVVQDLRRTYPLKRGLLHMRGRGASVDALRGISFQVARGEVFGLLGPNAAGKTTTIKILTTLLLPTGGTARVLGLDVMRAEKQVRRQIGFVFGGDRGFYSRVSARDNLRYFANLYGLDPKYATRRMADLLDLVGLTERVDDRVESYSRGMKQRLHIARALLHDPSVLFLDEPTIGLDPIAARELRDAITGLRELGKTILLTTHYMYEADMLCDRIGIINNGRLVALDTPRGLRRLVPGLFAIEMDVLGASEDDLANLERMPGVEALAIDERGGCYTLTLQSPLGAELIPRVQSALAGYQILRTVVREPTLEEAYIRIVNGQANAPAVEAPAPELVHA